MGPEIEGVHGKGARVRISATTLESFRLFMEGDWMPESDLIASIKGEFKPNHAVLLGMAFHSVLETPEKFKTEGGYCCGGYALGDDIMVPALALFDRRGVFECKTTKLYGEHTIVARADQLLGNGIIENKTTLSTFDFDRYAASCQWRIMVDLFEASQVTYNVFCLNEDAHGIIELKSIETFNLYPYAELRRDCDELVQRFVEYVTARGLTEWLQERDYAKA